MQSQDVYKAKNKIRIVTAASLFDGHDAAINIMRRILQSSGAEVIHLGHDRSVEDVVSCAVQEDVQAIAMTSYQGGHMEYFKYMYDLLKEKGAEHIKIFGGGGGTILPSEIKELQAYGIARIYHPDDGRKLGLQGMINDLLQQCDFPTGLSLSGELQRLKNKNPLDIARLISAAENYPDKHKTVLAALEKVKDVTTIPVLGITGTGGAGKSSLVDEILRRFLLDYPKISIAVLSVDPSKRKTGGALLGDRIRMNAVFNERVYMRSLATRQSNLALSKHISEALGVLKMAQFDLIILETSGIGQSDTEIVEFSNVHMYVMTPEFGAPSQLEKIDMLDYSDVVAINKFDRAGALDAIRDVRKQYKRNQKLWDTEDQSLPIYPTIASRFNDKGCNALYHKLLELLQQRFNFKKGNGLVKDKIEDHFSGIIPSKKVRYLSEITELIRNYNKDLLSQSDLVGKLQALEISLSLLSDKAALKAVGVLRDEILSSINPKHILLLEKWVEIKKQYLAHEFTFTVRDKEIKVSTTKTSLSGNKIPKVAVPKIEDKKYLLNWLGQENLPGFFPFTAGVFPFKREGEDPTRMFAGEGGPERTNRRFHYVSKGLPAKRLSTAFDSVTLYGNDPNIRPDIYGKIGNAGVSICTLDDAKRLYSGFDLTSPKTSVSMTINGPASMLTGFFMNAAIDQCCERYILENGLKEKTNQKIEKLWQEKGLERPNYHGELPAGNDGLGTMLLGVTGDKVLSKEVYENIKTDAIKKVRGTVQADILKEDQAQNTCIFSTEFALKMMGDMQAYFIDHGIRNFYSVSISGYHIAEAGANPISQLAFTLANGFTYVEYYLSRGMKIDDFAPNLSFFFSNGIDPEYAVIGRVARRIWAKAMKFRYGANIRGQKLKYHIQTSGRSLHAQEIAFNDIRTTLQALYAIYDNCNSLHTNAYDEAITTPTEESVRRAMAIQLIINHELGLAKNENPLQGAFIIEELTDLVEEAVMLEFDRINDRGGVLGAMETMYQRSKIQEESLHYEHLKHTGSYPIIGVNTFLNKEGSPTVLPKEIIRSTEAEKTSQIERLRVFQLFNQVDSVQGIEALKNTALNGGNTFEAIIEVAKVASLGQISNALFEVGGRYRRNM